MKKNMWTIAAIALLLSACKSTPTSTANADGTSNKATANKTHSKTNEKSTDLGKVYAAYLSNRQIYFDYDSDTLQPDYKNLISVHAKYLLSHPQTKILLQGHSDERGTPDYNLNLGERRAIAVKKAFNSQGVKNAQLETMSYGNTQASRECDDEDCHKKDRRVDISYGVK